MIRIIAAILCLQLVGCITTISVGEKFDSDIKTVKFKDDQIFGQGYLDIHETVSSDQTTTERYGIELKQGQEAINILPASVKELHSDIEAGLVQTNESGVALPTFADLQKGYTFGVFFVEGKRMLSLRNGGAYMVFDAKNAEKLKDLIAGIVAKNSGQSVVQQN